MLEGKTANNIVDRYHRIITGDQNQIQAGGGVSICKMTYDESSNIYLGASLRTSAIYKNELGYLESDDLSISSGEFGAGIYFLSNEAETEVELAAGQVLSLTTISSVSTRSVTITGDAEILNTDESSYWAILVRGDFTINVQLHN